MNKNIFLFVLCLIGGSGLVNGATDDCMLSFLCNDKGCKDCRLGAMRERMQGKLVVQQEAKKTREIGELMEYRKKLQAAQDALVWEGVAYMAIRRCESLGANGGDFCKRESFEEWTKGLTADQKDLLGLKKQQSRKQLSEKKQLAKEEYDDFLKAVRIWLE
jgi:hypothetical protein